MVAEKLPYLADVPTGILNLGIRYFSSLVQDLLSAFEFLHSDHVMAAREGLPILSAQAFHNTKQPQRSRSPAWTLEPDRVGITRPGLKC